MAISIATIRRMKAKVYEKFKDGALTFFTRDVVRKLLEYLPPHTQIRVATATLDPQETMVYMNDEEEELLDTFWRIYSIEKKEWKLNAGLFGQVAYVITFYPPTTPTIIPTLLHFKTEVSISFKFIPLLRGGERDIEVTQLTAAGFYATYPITLTSLQSPTNTVNISMGTNALSSRHYNISSFSDVTPHEENIYRLAKGITTALGAVLGSGGATSLASQFLHDLLKRLREMKPSASFQIEPPQPPAVTVSPHRRIAISYETNIVGVVDNKEYKTPISVVIIVPEDFDAVRRIELKLSLPATDTEFTFLFSMTSNGGIPYSPSHLFTETTTQNILSAILDSLQHSPPSE